MDTSLEPYANGVKTVAEILAAAGVPIVGLLPYFMDRLANDRSENLVDVIASLNERVALVQEHLDRDFLHTAEATAFTEDVMLNAVRLSETSKRAYYATAYANGLIRNRPSEDNRNRMIDTLARLRKPHLALLAAARTDDRFTIPLGAIVDVSADNGYLSALGPGIRFEILNIDWQDLRRAGLVTNVPVSESPYPGYRQFITQYGFEFDQFVRVPYADVHERT